MAAPAHKKITRAVHRHRHLSKQGLLERAFTFAFRGLVYAQIWEDPAVDMEALAITPDCHVVTIAPAEADGGADLAGPRRLSPFFRACGQPREYRGLSGHGRAASG